MRVIIVRHAKAEPGDPDELRPLAPRGREQARELGELLAAKHP
ncbi:MAG: histidine phosphatase family protein, partial [Actinobacteria bacterium]|nr:histidine phosphatase family protein [Actinomycetota bacterium]